MKAVVLTAAALAVFAPALRSQNPEPVPAPVDSLAMRRPMGPGPGFQGDPQRMQELRRQVEERWGRMVQTQLELSDQQMERVRAATRAHQDRRRGLARRRGDLERGIQGQMLPGVAADQDSLARMLEAMAHLRVQDAQSDEQLNRDLDFLTPVQRARFFIMTRRFEERLRAIRERALDERPGAIRRQPGMQGRPAPERPMDDDLDD